MKGKLTVLLSKEVKELVRDPKILFGLILMPLLIYPLMGVVLSAAFQTGVSREPILVKVEVYDTGFLGKYIPNLLRNYSTVKLVEGVGKFEVEIIVPENFTTSILAGKPGILQVTFYVNSTGFGSMSRVGVTSEILQQLRTDLAKILAKRFVREIEPNIVINPVKEEYTTYFRGKPYNIHPQVLIGMFFGQAWITPVVLSLVMVFAVNIAAVSIAQEKESKTLETLLSLPVSRSTILFSKITGSLVIALIASVTNMLGFYFYIQSIPGFEGQQTTLTLPMTTIPVIGIALFVGIMTLLTLSMILAVMAEDVRSAQALVGNFALIIWIPAFYIMFADIESLPLYLRLLITLIPASSPFLAAKLLPVGEYLTPLISILINLVEAVVFLVIAAKIFESEKILTMRLRFGKKKTRPVE